MSCVTPSIGADVRAQYGLHDDLTSSIAFQVSHRIVGQRDVVADEIVAT